MKQEDDPRAGYQTEQDRLRQAREEEAAAHRGRMDQVTAVERKLEEDFQQLKLLGGEAEKNKKLLEEQDKLTKLLREQVDILKDKAKVVRNVWESTRTLRDSCKDQVRSSQSTLRRGGVRGAGQHGGAPRRVERASGSCAVSGRVVRILARRPAWRRSSVGAGKMKIGDNPKPEVGEGSKAGAIVEHVITNSGAVELPLLTRANYHEWAL
ncbi:hypothetical protein ACQ4PT_040312 [Festuca glaucescens]